MILFYTMSVRDNILQIEEAVRVIASRTARDPEGIRIIAVTKTVPAATVREALDAGLRLFGENRVQEARKKISELALDGSTAQAEWHLIGHLQKNKAKYAVRLFDLIHTVDSHGLAGEIDSQAAKHGKVQRVLVQVKLSDETAKHGVQEEEALHLIRGISVMKNLALEGLMVMPPFFEDAEMARPYFRRLRQLRDDARKAGFFLPELSMGMSHDYHVAIEEGASMIRIGTAIFGERTK